MLYRRMNDAEYKNVLGMIYDSIHCICINEYSEKELDAWMPKDIDVRKFRESLFGAYNIVAEDNGQIVGFLSMTSDGYINRLFTHKNHVRKGIGTSLLSLAEKKANSLGLSYVTLDSSKTAYMFYLKCGYKDSGISQLQRNNVTLYSHIMKKKLGD